MTREEAINEIKSWDFLEGKEIEAIHTLIPELRESKDERIRKEIIDFIQWAEDRGMTRHDYHQAKRPAVWIAYLEKQKECVVDNNKTSAEEDERIRARLIEYFKGFLEGYEDCYKDGGRVKWEGLDVKSILAWLEKQKEQKPSCWNSPVMTNEMIMDEQKPDSLIYDKDLDKAAREFYLSGGADSPVDSTGLVPIVRMAEFGATWMKDRMEKEQKPAEWSEEDSKRYISIGTTLETSVVLSKEDYDANMAWLRELVNAKKYHLRPSWKPSEEQMEALEYVIRDYREDSCNATANYLQEILDHLKNM